MAVDLWKRRPKLVQIEKDGRIVQPGVVNDLLDDAVNLIGNGLNPEILCRELPAIKGAEHIAMANDPERPETTRDVLPIFRPLIT